MTIPDPPVLSPNEIDALYFQRRNNGEFYIGQLGGPPLHIDDWKQRELGRYVDAELARRRTERERQTLNPFQGSR